MVRQINKGYGELQVMHLDLTSDETDWNWSWHHKV